MYYAIYVNIQGDVGDTDLHIFDDETSSVGSDFTDFYPHGFPRLAAPPLLSIIRKKSADVNKFSSHRIFHTKTGACTTALWYRKCSNGRGALERTTHLLMGAEARLNISRVFQTITHQTRSPLTSLRPPQSSNCFESSSNGASVTYSSQKLKAWMEEGYALFLFFSNSVTTQLQYFWLQLNFLQFFYIVCFHCRFKNHTKDFFWRSNRFKFFQVIEFSTQKHSVVLKKKLQTQILRESSEAKRLTHPNKEKI